MTALWSGLAPVALPVRCLGDNHEIRWTAGVITAEAHRDMERERALTALGGEPSPCVQIVDGWARHADDLDVLILGSRGPGDRLEQSSLQLQGTAAPGHHGFTSYVPVGGPGVGHMAPYTSSVTFASWSGASRGFGHMPRRYVDYEEGPVPELALLLSLGAGLPQRLSATVIAAWADRIETGDDRVTAATPSLDAALYGRVGATLQSWFGTATTMRLTMQPPGSDPTIGRDGTDVRIELPFAWLRDVWANGLAIVLDRFCIQAQHSEPGTWTLTTVDRDLGAPRTVTITG